MKSFFAPLLALACLVAFTGCEPQRDLSHRVKLLPETNRIPSPNTTFELRFDDPMASAAQLGAPVPVSPLAIRPALAGAFAWTSPRTGVFAPTEPPILGTTYHFSLLPGLRNAAGQPAAARLHRALTTPPLQIHSDYPRPPQTNASAKPAFRLNFNSAVNPASAAAFLEFRNAAGQRHPARVTAPRPDSQPADEDDSTRDFQFYGSYHATWRASFNPRENAPAPRSRTAPAAPEPPPAPRDNLLHVTPATPLPVGDGWQLVAKPGLPASDSPAQLAAEVALEIGNVKPFTVSEITPHNRLSRGKTLELKFPKPLAHTLDATNALAHLTLEPQPAALTANVQRDKIILHADFALDRAYTVRVAPGLPSADGHQLTAEFAATARFEALPPRLYFKIFREDQLSAGRRQFELLTVNVPSFRLRARQLDRNTLIHALRGYGGYFRERDSDGGHNHFSGGLWYDHDEPYREVDFNSVPGKVIYQRTHDVNAARDEASARSFAWDDLAGKNARGAFFIAAELTPPHNRARAQVGTQALVQLTDLGLVWKRGGGATVAHVFSYATGLPVTNAAVRILTDDNVVVAEQNTDEQGLATLAAAPDGRWLLAEKDDDLHALSLVNSEHNLNLWGFNIPLETENHGAPDFEAEPQPPTDPALPTPPPARLPRRVFLFSDRPVYRPGETFHLKGIVRLLATSGTGLRVPKPNRVRLTAFDQQNNSLFTTNTTLTELGSFAASFALPATVLGACRIEALLNQQTHTLSFQVQEFEPPAFEVAFKTPAEFRANDPLVIPLRAQYFLGKPLARARVRWTLNAADEGFTPAGFEDFAFGNRVDFFRGDLGQRDSTLTLQGEEPLSATGELKLQPAIPFNPRAPQPRTVRVHAEVTDANQQTIAAAATFVRHSSDFYLGLREFKGVLHAGESFPLEVIAVTTDGKPAAQNVPVRATLSRIEWATVRVAGAGHARAYRSEPQRREITALNLTTLALQRRGDVWETSASAAHPDGAPRRSEAAPRLTPPAAGLYLLELAATDATGQRVQTTVSFNVSGPQPLAWDYRNELQIDLVPDRKSYRVGQTAEILVKTPISGPALITIERENVRRSYVTNLTGNAPLLSIPIVAGDAPNIFVSVLLTRGLTDSRRQIKQPEHRFGVCQLLVEAPRTRLHVAVTTPAADYEPGQPIAITAAVTDAARQPVSGAEVTLYAVDDAILSLMGGQAPEPHGFFHAPRPLAVRTGASLTAVLSEDPEALGFFNKGYLVGGGGDAANRLRKDFPACPLWLAAVLTDENGKVSATLPAPDALTRYRLIAVAHAEKDRFGHGQATVQINKPLMLQPAPPRFANVGDRLLVRAVLLNNTDKPGAVEVALQLDATASATNLTRKISVAALSSVTLDFPVEFRETGDARWIWSARFADAAPGKFADRVQSTFTVRHPAPVLHEVLGGVSTNSVPNLLADANPQLLAGRGTLDVRVSNTRLSELEWAAEHLLHYPYGCVEQTTSSLLPWLLLGDARDVLPQMRQTPAQFRAAIQAGIARLVSMQTPSGGLSYWPGHGGEAQLWGSAYGAIALALAKSQKQTVPAEPFAKLLAYLSRNLRSDPARSNAAFVAEAPLALLALALAGQPEPAYHELLFQNRTTLNAANRALLALAILNAKGSHEQAATLLALTPGEKLPPDEWFGSAARDTAVRLLAWCRLQPASPEVARHVTQLLTGRRAGHWTTTQGNAWALFALTEYARRVEGTRQPASGSVAWGTNTVPIELAGTPAVKQTTFTLTAGQDTQPLRLDNLARTPLYTQVRIAARSPAIQQPRQDRGFSVRRTYQRLNERDELTTLDGLRVGDRVVVTLDLEAREAARYVAVDDPLPALLEALHPEFLTQQTSVSVSSNNWWSDHQELRTDRALFFRDHLEAGRYTIRYLARVRTAGTATAPSTKVEEMYDPDRHGLTETQTLTSAPLE